MMRRAVPIVFGIAGCAVLVSLGVWQLQRLAWKEAVLAEIDARIGAAPVGLPEAPDPGADRYLPVVVEGRTTGEDVLVLVSTREAGAGYRIISAFETVDGRRIMVDEGFVREADKARARPAVPMRVTGNLHWPSEVDGFTPDPDPGAGLFFARDVPAMAAALGTEPVLVIARGMSGAEPRATPFPVTSEGIPNNHLGYAVQWFGLAAVWAAMTLIFLRRQGRKDET